MLKGKKSQFNPPPPHSGGQLDQLDMETGVYKMYPGGHLRAGQVEIGMCRTGEIQGEAAMRKGVK